MRHGQGFRLLSRTKSHRKALLRTLVTQLLKHGRIRTTVAKAKEARKYADKMITHGKKGAVANRRQAERFVREKAVIDHLFTELADRYTERNGGYTRVVRCGHRRGDGADMAILELVDREGEVRPPRTVYARTDLPDDASLLSAGAWPAAAMAAGDIGAPPAFSDFRQAKDAGHATRTEWRRAELAARGVPVPEGTDGAVVREQLHAVDPMNPALDTWRRKRAAEALAEAREARAANPGPDGGAHRHRYPYQALLDRFVAHFGLVDDEGIRVTDPITREEAHKALSRHRNSIEPAVVRVLAEQADLSLEEAATAVRKEGEVISKRGNVQEEGTVTIEFGPLADIVEARAAAAVEVADLAGYPRDELRSDAARATPREVADAYKEARRVDARHADRPLGSVSVHAASTAPWAAELRTRFITSVDPALDEAALIRKLRDVDPVRGQLAALAHELDPTGELGLTATLGGLKKPEVNLEAGEGLGLDGIRRKLFADLGVPKSWTGVHNEDLALLKHREARRLLAQGKVASGSPEHQMKRMGPWLRMICKPGKRGKMAAKFAEEPKFRRMGQERQEAKLLVRDEEPTFMTAGGPTKIGSEWRRVGTGKDGRARFQKMKPYLRGGLGLDDEYAVEFAPNGRPRETPRSAKEARAAAKAALRPWDEIPVMAMDATERRYFESLNAAFDDATRGADFDYKTDAVEKARAAIGLDPLLLVNGDGQQPPRAAQ